MSFLFSCCFNKIMKSCNVFEEKDTSPSFVESVKNNIMADIKINRKKRQLKKEMEQRKKIRDKKKYELLNNKKINSNNII